MAVAAAVCLLVPPPREKWAVFQQKVGQDRVCCDQRRRMHRDASLLVPGGIELSATTTGIVLGSI